MPARSPRSSTAIAANPRVRTVRAAVEPDTIEGLLRGAGVPEEPDLLVIDVDGNDYWIWRALEAFRPRVVVIEYNGDLDPTVPRVMPYAPAGAGTTRAATGRRWRRSRRSARTRATGWCTPSSRA